LTYGFDADGFEADVGVFMDVEIDGNANALTLIMDVDLCGVIGTPITGNYSDCASDWTALSGYFPIEIIDHKFDFSDACGPAKTSEVIIVQEEEEKKKNAAAMRAPQPVCCSKCTNNCVWSGIQHECTVGC